MSKKTTLSSKLKSHLVVLQEKSDPLHLAKQVFFIFAEQCYAAVAFAQRGVGQIAAGA